MHYKFSIASPHSHYLSIDFYAGIEGKEFVEVKLPAWRPGRYELGNFARNIQRWKPFDENGNELEFKKVAKDVWYIETKDVKQLHIAYNYYAAQLDAGACWLDANQLYVNPVHCCLYIDDKINEPCTCEMLIPASWKTATSLKQNGNNQFVAANFDELVDSPFISSPSLQHNSYLVNNTRFNIWIEGDCTPDWNKILTDFKKFTMVQLTMMEDFPFDEYHFLIQATPHSFYHGVEHLKSTVLAIGPAVSLMKKELYDELLGVASHELFHVWNIKSIRPIEMLPYNYGKENYAITGYVYEGATTYYGDLFLLRSGYFSVEEYFKELNVRLQRHMNNFGRFNYSVAQSSFDTWLDGYTPGVTNRKTSIYDEGCLISLMLDFLIRKHSAGKHSLDNVLHDLYHNFAKTKKGYAAADYQMLAEKYAGKPMHDFFDRYVYKANSYESLLQEVLTFAGLVITTKESLKSSERIFGFSTDEQFPYPKVVNIVPGSPADVGGLSRGDEVISINGHKADSRFFDLLQSFSEKEVVLDLFASSKKKTVLLKADGKPYLSEYRIKQAESINQEQELFLNAWIK